jgi:hypothetical protein
MPRLAGQDRSERCVLTDVDGKTKYGFTATITSVHGSDVHLNVQVDKHPLGQ